MILLNIKLVLETCVSISSCFIHEAYAWMEEVTSSNSCAFDASFRREFDKVNVASLESSQVSHACVKYSMV